MLFLPAPAFHGAQAQPWPAAQVVMCQQEGKPAASAGSGGKSGVSRPESPEEKLLEGKDFAVRNPFQANEAQPPATQKSSVTTTVFIERNFAVGAPFHEVAATVRRDVKRFGLDAFQLFVDGFVDGPDRFFQMRLEGCRDLSSGVSFRASFCIGVGALFDPFSKNFHPRGAVSGEAEYSDGRLYSAGFYERNLSGPPFTYFEHEHGVMIFDFERGRIVTAFNQRTANRARAKVELDFGKVAFYGLFGPRGVNQSPVTVGTRFTF
jgi:hypothetical protein